MSDQYNELTEQEPVIGIDLGTTNSCVGVWDWKGETVNIATTEQGARTIPSVVCFHKGDVLVGAAAKRKLTSHPRNTIYTSKRVIGRPYSHIRKEDIDGWTFDLLCTENDRPRYKVTVGGEEKLISPEEIGALILSHLKSVAETFIGREVTRAVITVPAYFTEPQRRATRDAGLLAGLDVVRMLPEPTAAALAFGLDRRMQHTGDSHVLVFDMGGGTFDVSILMLDGRGSFVTKAVTGDFHLGGEDFDDLLLNWIMSHELFPKGPVPGKTRQKLRKQCEEVKRELSTGTEACIEVDVGGTDVQIDVTRHTFEGLCQPLFDNAMGDVEEALELAEIGKDDIGSIVLVGGSTRIPRLQHMLQHYFNGKKLWCGINPDEAVAWGATALAAALATGRRQTMGSSAPAQQSVAGASVPLRGLTLTSITPITLGIELNNGTMDVLIPRGSKIPSIRSDEYTTAVENQKSVVIKVYEGESTEKAKDNSLLGKFSLPVDDAVAGVPRVRVSFEITSDGLFLVTARDVKNGNEIIVKLENSNLTGDEKDEIVAAVGSERARFRSLISQVFGLASEAQDKDLLGLCTVSLEWLQSYPEASKQEVQHRFSRLEQAAKSLK